MSENLQEPTYKPCKRQGCSQVVPNQGKRDYCSRECRKLEWRVRSGNTPGTNRVTSVALAEAIATVDLLQRGFEVYRSVSASRFLIMKEGECKRVDIRCGYLGADNKLRHNPITGEPDLAAIVVVEKSQVFYLTPSEFTSVASLE